MRRLAMIAFVMTVPCSLFADALSKKHNDILRNQENRNHLTAQRIQERNVDLSPFNIDFIGAWKNDLRIPTTSNDGIEILPYKVDQSPS